MSKVERLYARAQKRQNHPQVYKCLLSGKSWIFSERRIAKLAGIIQRLESRLPNLLNLKCKWPGRFWGIVLQNVSPSGQLSQRQINYFRCWAGFLRYHYMVSMNHCSKSNAYYLQSLKSEESKQSSLEDYEAILTRTGGLFIVKHCTMFCLTGQSFIFHRRNPLTDFEDGIPWKIGLPRCMIFYGLIVREMPLSFLSAMVNAITG